MRKNASSEYHVKHDVKNRTIYLKGQITAITPVLIKKAIMAIEPSPENCTKPIFFFITCTGGDFVAALTIWQTLDPYYTYLVTVAVDKAVSAGMTITQLGKYRFATSGTKFLIHSGTKSLSKDTPLNKGQLLDMFKELATIDANQLTLLSRHGRPISTIRAMIEGESGFRTKYAITLKLIDGVFEESDPDKIRKRFLAAYHKAKKKPRHGRAFLITTSDKFYKILYLVRR
ncbi:MAG: ATP-dependent Clp protease proteolytic subunit [bacterium]|nr:ATP-dependent Clp protease proteolytic subunit [bacterium]